MVEAKKNTIIGVMLAAAFILVQLFFQLQMFNFTSITVILLMITVAFLSEKNRLFVWVIVSYAAGLFIFIYLDRILLEFSMSRVDLFIWNRMLLLVPIALISYVLFMFKEVPTPYLKKPKWEQYRTFNFTLFGAKIWSPKTFFQLFIGIHLIVLLFLVGNSLPVDSTVLFKVLLYSIVNSILVELLWRGILLSRMVVLVGANLAIFCTSILSALAFYMFGFSFAFSIFFFVMSLFLGTITYKTKSLFPTILWNIILTNILIFLDIIPLLRF